MSNLARTVSKVKNYPKWVLSFLIGRTVRFVGTAGISFEEMSTERVVASIKNKPKIRNHIGQVHAGAMILLAETATGMLVGMKVPYSDVIASVTFMAILLTILLQATTTGWLARKLDLSE